MLQPKRTKFRKAQKGRMKAILSVDTNYQTECLGLKL